MVKFNSPGNSPRAEGESLRDFGLRPQGSTCGETISNIPQGDSFSPGDGSEGWESQGNGLLNPSDDILVQLFVTEYNRSATFYDQARAIGYGRQLLNLLNRASASSPSYLSQSRLSDLAQLVTRAEVGLGEQWKDYLRLVERLQKKLKKWFYSYRPRGISEATLYRCLESLYGVSRFGLSLQKEDYYDFVTTVGSVQWGYARCKF